MPSLLRYKLDSKVAMLARYARRVWKIDVPDDRKAAEQAIARTEEFMARMGCPVRISDEGIALDADDVVAHLERAGHTSLGEARDVRPIDVRQILQMAQ